MLIFGILRFKLVLNSSCSWSYWRSNNRIITALSLFFTRSLSIRWKGCKDEIHTFYLRHNMRHINTSTQRMTDTQSIFARAKEQCWLGERNYKHFNHFLWLSTSLLLAVLIIFICYSESILSLDCVFRFHFKRASFHIVRAFLLVFQHSEFYDPIKCLNLKSSFALDSQILDHRCDVDEKNERTNQRWWQNVRFFYFDDSENVVE